MDWYLSVLKKYAVFSGRARRKEYWMFFLFNIVISIVLAVIDGKLGSGKMGMLGMIYSLAVLLPGIGVSIRRLHDTGRSGWWLLLGLIPLLGVVVLLIFMIQDSQSGNNEYGANPKEGQA